LTTPVLCENPKQPIQATSCVPRIEEIHVIRDAIAKASDGDLKKIAEAPLGMSSGFGTYIHLPIPLVVGASESAKVRAETGYLGRVFTHGRGRAGPRLDWQ